ncbi:MAG: energy transducer TonB, partial [Gammaproteobacteria bacterium]
REQATVNQPAVVAEQPAPAAATVQDTTGTQQGIAPAIDGMDVMFYEYVRENYEHDLNRWLRERGTVYPPEAREQGLEGNALAVFSLDRDGRILSLRLGKSSGVPVLDEAALETIRRAAPFPPPPAGLPFAVIEDIYLPVRFRLQPPGN